MEQLLTHFFKSLGAASLKHVSSLFRWDSEQTKHALNRMVESKQLLDNLQVEGKTEPHYLLPEIADQLVS